MNNKVLACVDRSGYTTSVCDYAAWAALRLNAPLEFIHVLDRHPEKAPKLDFSGSIGLGAQESLLEELSSLDEQRSRIAQELGRQLLDTAEKRAASNGVTGTAGRQRHGTLVDTLTEMEPEARLFVLGQRGEDAEAAPEHIGSNLERIVRALHKPVLVASREFRLVRKVMVAFDGSASARKGIDMLASSPLFRGCVIHVVMAGTTAGVQLDWARNTLLAVTSDVTTAQIEGEPEPALTGYAQANEIDLIVMGAYGHSRIRQLLVGSTTTALIRTSAIPLLLLR